MSEKGSVFFGIRSPFYDDLNHVSEMCEMSGRGVFQCPVMTREKKTAFTVNTFGAKRSRPAARSSLYSGAAVIVFMNYALTLLATSLTIDELILRIGCQKASVSDVLSTPHR